MTDQNPDQPGEPDKNAPLVAGHDTDEDRETDQPGKKSGEEHGTTPQNKQGEGAADQPHSSPENDPADEWGEESFPASDPPSNY